MLVDAFAQVTNKAAAKRREARRAKEAAVRAPRVLASSRQERQAVQQEREQRRLQRERSRSRSGTRTHTRRPGGFVSTNKSVLDT